MGRIKKKIQRYSNVVIVWTNKANIGQSLRRQSSHPILHCHLHDQKKEQQPHRNLSSESHLIAHRACGNLIGSVANNDNNSNSYGTPDMG